MAALAAHAEAVRASHHLELFCYGNLSPEATVDLADQWRASHTLTRTLTLTRTRTLTLTLTLTLKLLRTRP